MAEATQALAAFAAGLGIEAIPMAAREATKKLILDALACALAGHKGEETGQVAALCAALGESQGGGDHPDVEDLDLWPRARLAASVSS